MLFVFVNINAFGRGLKHFPFSFAKMPWKHPNLPFWAIATLQDPCHDLICFVVHSNVPQIRNLIWCFSKGNCTHYDVGVTCHVATRGQLSFILTYCNMFSSNKYLYPTIWPYIFWQQFYWEIMKSTRLWKKGNLALNLLFLRLNSVIVPLLPTYVIQNFLYCEFFVFFASVVGF